MTTSRIPPGMASGPEWDNDRIRAEEIDSLQRKAWLVHGQPGHTGFRCMPCALEGPDPHLIYTPAQLIDSHQNNVLDWNERCDKMVQDHLIYCPGGQSLAKCVQGHYPMPAKPTMPKERIR